jgi:hypothetical protein
MMIMMMAEGGLMFTNIDWTLTNSLILTKSCGICTICISTLHMRKLRQNGSNKTIQIITDRWWISIPVDRLQSLPLNYYH